MNLLKLYLKNSLKPSGRVGAAQRDLTNEFIVQGGDLTQPRIQKHEIRSVVEAELQAGAWRAGRRTCQRQSELGVRKVWLISVGRRLIKFAQQPLDVDSSRRNSKVVPVGSLADLESIILLRHTRGPYYIDGFSFRSVYLNRELLVPVGIELHPALLHKHAAVVLLAIECLAAVVTWHWFPPVFAGLAREKDSRLQPEAQVLIEARSQVGFALRLIQIVERSHLG